MAKKRVAKKKPVEAAVESSVIDTTQVVSSDDMFELDDPGTTKEMAGVVAKHSSGLAESEKTFGEVEILTSDKNKPVDITDPGWTAYVLDQLDEKEKYEGHPKADGLRRLVEKLIGPITSMVTNLCNHPIYGGDEHSKNTATACCTMAVWNVVLEREVTCSAVADASCYSCKSPYDKFLSSIAETRAEGRVYRKLLRLINVCTSDEISELPKDMMPDRISTNQIDVIERLCTSLDINLQKMMHVATKEKKTSIKHYLKEQAMVVLEKLHDVQNKEKPVPPAILGYESDWREYFGQ